jgi:hypothetical protein
MSEPGYFERLSQRALAARSNGGEPSGRDASEETSWDGARDRLVAHRYRLEKRIGRGRLGDIFEAVDEAGRDVGANRRVAIQLIDDKIAANQRIADGLARAYAVLRTTSHPNVVRILDFATNARVPHVVMDLLEGVSLRSVLEDAAPEPLGVDETWPVVLAVGEALQYLHAKGLTHGDLRPESVFITFQYGIKLLDLAPHLPSLAPFYVEDTNKTANAKTDPCDDVYGLACLTYELLSGRHPFNANTPLEAHRAGLVPRPISGLNLRDWDAIAHGLELERARRTPTVKQFLHDLALTGNERLRAASDAIDDVPSSEPPRPAAVAPPRPPPAPAVARSPAPSATPTPTAARSAAATRWVLEDPPPVVRREQHVRVERRAERYRDDFDDEASTRRWAFFRGALQATFSLAVIAGIVAFAVINYDGLRSAATDSMSALEEFDPARSRGARPLGDALDSASSSVEPESGGETQLARSAEPASASDRAGRPTAESLSAAPPAAQQASAPNEPETAAPPAAAGGDGATGAAPAEPAAHDAPRTAEPQVISVVAPAVSGSPVPSGSPFEFARPVVAVSERESAVAVVINRSGDYAAPATLAWWVSGDSATPDNDYPELGQRVERLAAGQESLTVFIPLVRDATPERTETFHVYVGRYDSARRHLDAMSSMQVDIVDDD